MPPKLPADHPTGQPGVQPNPKERAELTDSAEQREGARDAGEEAHAVPEDEERRSETLLQDLAAAASTVVPEAGVAEAPTGAGRRNRTTLIASILAVLIAAGLLLWIAV